MKIAVDVSISEEVVMLLKANRCNVVVHAQEGEPDEAWLPNAIELGATVFFSSDVDVPLYLDKWTSGCHWVDIPQGLRKEKQFDFIVNKLVEIKYAI